MNNKHINGFNTSVFTTPASNGTDQQFYSDTMTANYDLYVGNVNVMAEIATKQDIINSNVNLEVDTLTANKIICPLYNDDTNIQFTINDVLKMELSNSGLVTDILKANTLLNINIGALEILEVSTLGLDLKNYDISNVNNLTTSIISTDEANINYIHANSGTTLTINPNVIINGTLNIDNNITTTGTITTDSTISSSTLTTNKIICPLYDDNTNLQFTINDVLKMELSSDVLDIFSNSFYCGNIETSNIDSSNATITNINSSNITATSVSGTTFNSTTNKTNNITSDNAYINILKNLNLNSNDIYNIDDITANTITTDIITTDSVNTRIGINKPIPLHTLHVGGNIYSDADIISTTLTASQVNTTYIDNLTGILTINPNSLIINGTMLLNNNLNMNNYTFTNLPTLTTTNLIIDTNLLFTDSTMNRIGINNATPTESLYVIGNIKNSGTFKVEIVQLVLYPHQR